MAQVSKDFIISALRGGFGEAQIAEALNVTVGAVEQLINAHGLRDLAVKNSKFENIDNKLNTIEEKVLEQLDKQVRFIQDPMKLTRILQVVNGSKRRSLAEGRPIQDNSVRLVQLNLPERAELNVTLNARKEVIGLNGREFSTMPSGQVVKDLPNHKELTYDGTDEPPKTARAGDYL